MIGMSSLVFRQYHAQAVAAGGLLAALAAVLLAVTFVLVRRRDA